MLTISPQNADIRTEMRPLEGDRHGNKVGTLELWKRGQFVPLTGVSEQLEAVGKTNIDAIQIRTVSGNEYRISKIGNPENTNLNDIHALKVENVRSREQFIVPAKAASHLTAVVGMELDFGNGSSTATIKEILIPCGARTGGDAKWVV